jgi:hypothetical protein
VAILAGAGAAAIAITVLGVRHFATRAQPITCVGNLKTMTITWQPPPATGLPTAQAASVPATQTSAKASTQTTAAEQ